LIRRAQKVVVLVPSKKAQEEGQEEQSSGLLPRPVRQTSHGTMREFFKSTHKHWSSQHSVCLSIMEAEHEDEEDDGSDSEFANLENGVFRYGTTSFENTAYAEDDNSFESGPLADPFVDDDDDALDEPASMAAMHHRSVDFFSDLRKRKPSFRRRDTDGMPISCFHQSYGSSSSTSFRWDLIASKAATSSSLPVRPPSRKLSATGPVMNINKTNNNNFNGSSSSSMQNSLSSAPQLPLRKISAHEAGGTFPSGGFDEGSWYQQKYPTKGAGPPTTSSMPPPYAPSRDDVDGSSSTSNIINNNDSMSSILSSSTETTSMEASPRMPRRKASTRGNYTTPANMMIGLSNGGHSRSGTKSPPPPSVEACPLRLPLRKASVHHES
jgi:hypothetical protein